MMRNPMNIAVRLSLLAFAILGAAGAHAATTVTPGVLKVGMEITYPPFESYDEQKNVVGSDPNWRDYSPNIWTSRPTSLTPNFPTCF